MNSPIPDDHSGNYSAIDDQALPSNCPIENGESNPNPASTSATGYDELLTQVHKTLRNLNKKRSFVLDTKFVLHVNDLDYLPEKLARMLLRGRVNIDVTCREAVRLYREVFDDCTRFDQFAKRTDLSEEAKQFATDQLVRWKRQLKYRSDELLWLNVESFTASQGEMFDNRIHSAESEISTDDPTLDQRIYRLLSPGFRWIDDNKFRQTIPASVEIHCYAETADARNKAQGWPNHV